MTIELINNYRECWAQNNNVGESHGLVRSSSFASDSNACPLIEVNAYIYTLLFLPFSIFFNSSIIYILPKIMEVKGVDRYIYTFCCISISYLILFPGK